jgi:hypothetical protein
MVTVPVVTGETIPEDDPIFATEISPLLHTPPDILFVRVVVFPIHTPKGPPIALGGVAMFSFKPGVFCSQPVVAEYIDVSTQR